MRATFVVLALVSLLAASAYGPPAAFAEADQGQLVTPGEDTTKGVSSTAETPLNDLNLRRQHIPPILRAAMADPYAPLGRLTCRTLADEISRLYVALGRDFDDPPPPKDESAKGMTRPGGEGLKLAHSAVQMLIPYDGFVRTLSGAQKRDELVLSAINAGNARRAYLKGLGEARGCPNPASPLGHGRASAQPTQFW